MQNKTVKMKRLVYECMPSTRACFKDKALDRGYMQNKTFAKNVLEPSTSRDYAVGVKML